MDVNEELKFLGNLKKIEGGRVGEGVGLGGGGQGRCEQGSEVFCENPKKKYFLFFFWGGGSGWGGGGGSGWM